MIYMFYGSIAILAWKCGGQLLKEAKARYKCLPGEEGLRNKISTFGRKSRMLIDLERVSNNTTTTNNNKNNHHYHHHHHHHHRHEKQLQLFLARVYYWSNFICFGFKKACHHNQYLHGVHHPSMVPIIHSSPDSTIPIQGGN